MSVRGKDSLITRKIKPNYFFYKYLPQFWFSQSILSSCCLESKCFRAGAVFFIVTLTVIGSTSKERTEICRQAVLLQHAGKINAQQK